MLCPFWISIPLSLFTYIRLLEGKILYLMIIFASIMRLPNSIEAKSPARLKSRARPMIVSTVDSYQINYLVLIEKRCVLNLTFLHYMYMNT